MHTSSCKNPPLPRRRVEPRLRAFIARQHHAGAPMQEPAGRHASERLAPSTRTQQINVDVARSAEQMHAAHTLVFKRYAWRGYCLDGAVARASSGPWRRTRDHGHCHRRPCHRRHHHAGPRWTTRTACRRDAWRFGIERAPRRTSRLRVDATRGRRACRFARRAGIALHAGLRSRLDDPWRDRRFRRGQPAACRVLYGGALGLRRGGRGALLRARPRPSVLLHLDVDEF